jgi:tRNA (cmo5U34)-methyltransferase
VTETLDTNAAVWQSEEGVASFLAASADAEPKFAHPRRLMVDLLPFGAAARAVLDRYPRAEAVLADFSPQMVAEGERALAPYAGRYRYAEFDLARGGWPAGLPDVADAVISSLCVHHLPDERKRELFGDILAHLPPGGWYLNFDPVTAEDPVVTQAWLRAGDRRDPAAAGKRAHRSPEEHRRWENHVRYMIPLAPQISFLRAAGFEGVDVYWKDLDYVIYGGRRPC